MTYVVSPDSTDQMISQMQQEIVALQRYLQFYLNVGGDLSGQLPNPTVVGASGLTWQSYSPTWTGSTTNPTIGNGAIIGDYALLGKLCVVRVNIQFGSTTNPGSGGYNVSLPFTATSAAETDLSAKIFDGNNWAGWAYWSGGTNMIPYFPTSSTNCILTQWASSSHGAPSGGNFSMWGAYQLA